MNDREILAASQELFEALSSDAAFLPEDAFADVVAGKVAADYESLRRTYFAFVPEELRSAGGTARQNSYAIEAGGNPWNS